MKVCDYGEIVLCRDILFEDNQYDTKIGHPAIILLPTSEKDDYIYCVYMTSDEKRAYKNENKFTKCYAKTQKNSYINLQQIIKKTNVINKQITHIEDEDFIDLLKRFYNYQVNLKPQKTEFLEIKSKVESLLQMLEMHEEFNIERLIHPQELEVIDSLQGTDKKRMIYSTYLLVESFKSSPELESQAFISPKDITYFTKLKELYYKIGQIDLDKLDFNDSNNEMRQIYIDVKNTNYLLNADTLFNDTATIFSMKENNEDIFKAIKSFLNNENERNIAKIESLKNKINAKKESSIDKNRFDKKEKAKAALIEKYGQFDTEFFGF